MYDIILHLSGSIFLRVISASVSNVLEPRLIQGALEDVERKENFLFEIKEFFKLRISGAQIIAIVQSTMRFFSTLISLPGYRLLPTIFSCHLGSEVVLSLFLLIEKSFGNKNTRAVLCDLAPRQIFFINLE